VETPDRPAATSRTHGKDQISYALTTDKYFGGGSRFSQRIFLTDLNMYTVPWAVTTFVDSPVRAHGGSYLPCPSSLWSRSFVSSFFGQKYMLKGIATTGLK